MKNKRKEKQMFISVRILRFRSNSSRIARVRSHVSIFYFILSLFLACSSVHWFDYSRRKVYLKNHFLGESKSNDNDVKCIVISYVRNGKHRTTFWFDVSLLECQFPSSKNGISEEEQQVDEGKNTGMEIIFPFCSFRVVFAHFASLRQVTNQLTLFTRIAVICICDLTK